MSNVDLVKGRSAERPAEKLKHREAKRALVGIVTDRGVEPEADFDGFKHWTSREVFVASALERVELIKGGVEAAGFKLLLLAFHIDQETMFSALNLKRATVNKKAAREERLSPDDSERIVGLLKLIGQVEAMVEESGETEDFVAERWLSTWLREPVPALHGTRPIDLLDTIEGQGIVSQILAQMQSGAYA